MARLHALRSPPWPGGLRALIAILLVQAGLVLVYVADWRYAVAAVVGITLVAVVLEMPVLGIALLVMARLMDTSQNAFIRIGRTAIGTFEIFLLLALSAFLVHVVRHRRPLLLTWPWLRNLAVFLGFVAVTLGWSSDRSDGLSELVGMGVVVANAVLILSFVRTPRDFALVLYAWILACVLIGLYSLGSDIMGVSDSGPWKAAEGGGRETGLGQQPNWYAMNLSFIIHTTFGLALIQRRALMRWVLVAAGLFIFFNMLRSGSRGAIYSIIIGGGLAALAMPLFRRWFLRFLVVVAALFIAATTLDWGSTSQALNRIAVSIGRTWSTYRAQNWQVCIRMFLDTWGLGIGAGGYLALLPRYNWFIYNSDYHYPHGIFWGLLAHYGVIGLGLTTWLVLTVLRMARDLARWTRGTTLEVFAWTMPATMLGYAAWSFVEFEYNEKPFWEFLTLYTALFLMVARARAGTTPLPDLPGAIGIPWRRARAAETEDVTEGRVDPRT